MFKRFVKRANIKKDFNIMFSFYGKGKLNVFASYSHLRKEFSIHYNFFLNDYIYHNIMLTSNTELIAIPESVDTIYFSPYCNNMEMLNNLPNHIETLHLMCDITEPISNLPLNIKCVYVKSNFTTDKLKVPFNCKIIPLY